MLVALYNEAENRCICKANVLFGLDVLIVRDCEGMPVNQLEDLLLQRAEFKDSYEMDEIVLKKLNLYHKKNLFGRMSEACVLYAMLNHFKLDTDNLALYPVKDELITMMGYDSKYSNLYIWEAKHDSDV